jgi:hypothetical protein
MGKKKADSLKTAARVILLEHPGYGRSDIRQSTVTSAKERFGQFGSLSEELLESTQRWEIVVALKKMRVAFASSVWSEDLRVASDITDFMNGHNLR